MWLGRCPLTSCPKTCAGNSASLYGFPCNTNKHVLCSSEDHPCSLSWAPAFLAVNWPSNLQAFSSAASTTLNFTSNSFCYSTNLVILSLSFALSSVIKLSCLWWQDWLDCNQGPQSVCDDVSNWVATRQNDFCQLAMTLNYNVAWWNCELIPANERLPELSSAESMPSLVDMIVNLKQNMEMRSELVWLTDWCHAKQAMTWADLCGGSGTACHAAFPGTTWGGQDQWSWGMPNTELINGNPKWKV